MVARVRLFPSLVALLLLVSRAAPLSAASTGTTELHTPQGSGAGTANGDYITASTGGLNTFYRYFIEVPPGLSRLTVEIFDADIGAGGASEDTAGRDRDRNGYNMTATYTLLDPGGTVQPTRFTTGNTTTPAGADNAWLYFYNASASTVRDNFGTASYANNDGTSNWAGNWIETDGGGGGGATGGSIQVTGGELRLQDVSSGSQSIYREVDLLGTPGLDLSVAFLTFTYRTSNTLDNNDEIDVEVSGNGGGSWTTLETFANDSSGSRSYDITAFIANNTRIRFVVNGLTSSDEFFYIDNLQIADGLPRTAGHWELRVSQSAGGDDINAFGIRAHDGTSGSGGTELNVYYDSHTSIGANPPGSGTTSRSYDLFPYITSGCTAAKNDFDFDSNRGNTGSLSLRSRATEPDGDPQTPNFTQSYASTSMSDDDDWRRETFSGWTSDTAADDYGIWEADLTITSYVVSGTPNGNYGHLSFTNSSAAANPPAANPTTNSFRVYLPTDAGTAPVKPFVEQLLTHKSGPNPVPVGQSSRYQVTVRVVNPGAQAITFSASNLVTANIPGGGAVYAGNAAVGQGTIVSQPSVGGTGNITWNPGTLAAGALSILTYQVNVTPASANQRIPVTATVASGNGTRAQFVDNTGNTTQARATYLFGPLCELAVTQGQLLTEAVVSSFRALPGRHGGVLTEWTTASEERTAGFRLLRRDRRTGRLAPVHEGLLAALAATPQGGTYRFLDEGVSPREPQVYVLEEVEASGRRRTHGPFRVSPWTETAEAPEIDRFDRTAHPAARRAEAAERPEQVVARALKPPGGSGPALHVSVRETGLVHLSRETLATASGRTAAQIEQQIAGGQLAVSRGGLPVAWHPDLGGDGSAAGLFFYGEAPDSLYSDVSVYKLDLGGPAGLLMEVESVAGTPAGTPAATFPEVRRTERDALPATAISVDPESDYWFWEFLQGGDPAFGVRTFSLDAPGVSAGGSAELAVDLHGATTTGTPGEHRVEVRLNGLFLGEAQWAGIAPHRATLAVPPGTLLPAGNQVELTGLVGGGAAYSFTYLEGFDLAYARSFQAAGESLTFSPDGAAGVTVSGFSDPAVRLLDVSDPQSPRWIEGATVEADTPAGWRLRFAPVASARYLAAGPAAVRPPVALRSWQSVPKFSRADYLVIAPGAWRDAAERLAGLRRSQGLSAAVVSLEEIADSFGGGVATPHAIQAFLAELSVRGLRRPRYVVLAGQGTLDYRDLLGHGDNVMPPLLVPNAGGLFPSDNRLGDVNGDGLPEMAVGRIPVLTAPGLQAYIGKLTAYETGAPADWARHVLLLSDAPDQGAVFAGDSERIAARIPSSFQAERIDLGTEPLTAARARLFAGLAEGAGLVNYVGHGGLDRLAAGGLLTSADVAGLTNGDRLPVLTAMTCTVNRFAVPGVPSLGEVLVERSGGGAVAVFGPSGLADSTDSRELAEIFYRRTAERGTLRLGDLILRSYAELRAQGGDGSLPDIYNLLGDPALRLRAAPETPAGGGSSGE